MNIIEELIKYILGWSNADKHMNKLFYTDKARYSEKFYAEVFSTTYSLYLENLNQIKGNFESIDLGDFKKMECFQITSSYSKEKIDKTIELFFEKKLNEKFKKIKIFFMCDEKDRSEHNRIIDDVRVEVMSLHKLFRDFEGLLPSNQRKLLELLKSEFDDKAEIRERSFWISRMGHQYPVILAINTGENTEAVNTFFNSRVVINSYNNDLRILLNNLLRELLHNVTKHGEPYRNQIQVFINRHQIRFYDWGKSYNPKKLAFNACDLRGNIRFTSSILAKKY